MRDRERGKEIGCLYVCVSVFVWLGGVRGEGKGGKGRKGEGKGGEGKGREGKGRPERVRLRRLLPYSPSSSPHPTHPFTPPFVNPRLGPSPSRALLSPRHQSHPPLTPPTSPFPSLVPSFPSAHSHLSPSLPLFLSLSPLTFPEDSSPPSHSFPQTLFLYSLRCLLPIGNPIVSC